MPGCERHSLESMVAEAKDAWQYGVRSFVIFPKVPESLKTNRGEEGRLDIDSLRLRAKSGAVVAKSSAAAVV